MKKKLLGNKQRKDQQARRGTSTSGLIKQETSKRSSTTSTSSISGILNSNNMVPGLGADYHYNIISTSNQNPYWPELPILSTPAPYSNDGQPCYNDHSSIRKLLIKLGGRFSDHHDDYNQPLIQDIGVTGPHIIPSSVPSQPPPAFGNSASHFAQQVQYNTDNNYGFGPQMLEQGQSSSSTSQLAAAELDHQESCIYNNVPAAQVLDGLEFLYTEDTTGNDKFGGNINSSITAYGTADIGWGEMSTSMVYNNSTTPNFVADYQSAQESCIF